MLYRTTLDLKFHTSAKSGPKPNSTINTPPESTTTSGNSYWLFPAF